MSLNVPNPGGPRMPVPVRQRQQSVILTSASNAHTVVTVVGLAIAGVLYLVIPGAFATASVGVFSPSVAPYWASALVVGGVLSFAGIAARKPRLEIFGLGLLGGAMMFATVAIVDVRQVAFWPAAAIYMTHGAAAMGRIVAVVHVERMRVRVALAARRAVETA